MSIWHRKQRLAVIRGTGMGLFPGLLDKGLSQQRQLELLRDAANGKYKGPMIKPTRKQIDEWYDWLYALPEGPIRDISYNLDPWGFYEFRPPRRWQ